MSAEVIQESTLLHTFFFKLSMWKVCRINIIISPQPFLISPAFKLTPGFINWFNRSFLSLWDSVCVCVFSVRLTFIQVGRNDWAFTLCPVYQTCKKRPNPRTSVPAMQLLSIDVLLPSLFFLLHPVFSLLHHFFRLLCPPSNLPFSPPLHQSEPALSGRLKAYILSLQSPCSAVREQHLTCFTFFLGKNEKWNT